MINSFLGTHLSIRVLLYKKNIHGRQKIVELDIFYLTFVFVIYNSNGFAKEIGIVYKPFLIYITLIQPILHTNEIIAIECISRSFKRFYQLLKKSFAQKREHRELVN